MSQAATTMLVEVRPLKPFVGTYKCGLADADIIDDETVEKDGVITKVKVARKRFAGFVPVERIAHPSEDEMIKGGTLPEHIEVLSAGPGPAVVREYPKQRTLMLPADLAKSLVERGLAEIISKGGRR